jgi:hypothetical protein
MPDFSNTDKADILRYLKSMPGAVAFEGWDKYGTPTMTDGASLHNWITAMKNPAYDEDIERALLASAQQLGPSAQQQHLKSINATLPQLKFIPQMDSSPVNINGETILGNGKYMKGK